MVGRKLIVRFNTRAFSPRINLSQHKGCQAQQGHPVCGNVHTCDDVAGYFVVDSETGELRFLCHEHLQDAQANGRPLVPQKLS